MSSLSDLQDAINLIGSTWRQQISNDFEEEAKAWMLLEDAARQVANGTTKAAKELRGTGGYHQWVVTVFVDGPGDYILIDPPEDI